MDANSMFNQVQGTLKTLNPLLDNLPGAEEYFKKKVGEAYQYNKPVIENAAKLESDLYSLPGQAMDQYNQEFGGQAGLSAGARIQGMLGQLGEKSKLANTAWGLVDNANMRTNDLAKSLLGQYQAKISAAQAKLQPQMSLWDRLYSEQQANARSRAGSGGGSAWSNPFANLNIKDSDGDGIPDNVDSKPNTPNATAASNKGSRSLLDKISATGSMFGVNVPGALAKVGKVPIINKVGTGILNTKNKLGSLSGQYGNLKGSLSNIWK